MEALFTGSAPVAEAAKRRTSLRVLHGPALTLAVGLCAALPVIAAAARALHEGWQPVADRGIIATRSFDVLSSHMPLVGQYSFAGNVTGKLTYSLGPMLYWLLAPAAHVGAPASFVLTMAAVNVASVLGAVALARRRGGVWLMVAAAIGIGLMCRSLAANNFYDIWNPSAGLFPLLLLIFVCWSLACGDYRLLPLAILVASFEAQCEDAFVPPALAALAVGVVGLAIWWVAQRRAGGPGRRGVPWRWIVASVLVLLVCWTPPLIDQVAHSGNLGLVFRAATKRHSSLGARVGARAVIHTVGVTPWWLTRPSDPFVRKHDVRRATSTLASVSTAMILGWLLLAIALALRRRRGDIVAGAAMALALCAAIWSIANATPANPRFIAETLGYTLWSATTVGMFVWLIALWSAVVLSGADALAARAWRSLTGPRPRRPARVAAAGVVLASLLAVALAALAGGVGAASGDPDEHAFEFSALTSINARLGAVPRGHSVFLNARLDGLITPLRPELTYDLRRRGVRALGNGAYLRTGHWYERTEHPYDYVVWVYDNGRLPVKDAKLIATAHIRSGGREHAVQVAISPVPPRARAATRRAATVNEGAGGARGLAAVGVWSAPKALGGCAGSSEPRVAFPSEGPFDPTGPGAIVWSEPASCAGAGAARLSVSALGAAGASSEPLAAAPAAVSAVGASFGRVAVLATPPASAAAQAALLEGSAGRGLTRALGLGADPQPSLARAYLGDVAVAAVAPGPAIAVRVQRYFRRGFDPALLIPIAPGRVSALTATMDYRSDVLVAWRQNGAIYAHMLRASGRREPTQRLGASAPDPQLRALVSDNDHGMVAWSSTAATPGAPAHTSTYVDLSAAGVRFRAPRLLASFADPARAGPSAGSLALVRLSNENVMLAWTTSENGHYAVRAAPAVFAGTRPAALLSDPRGQAVLADLAAGPAGEAIAAWRATPAGSPFDPARVQLWTARAFLGRGDRPGTSAAALVAPAGANRAVSVAVDPASDRAVAAWLVRGSQAPLRYASAAGAAGYRPHPPATGLVQAGSGTHWLRIALAAVAFAALLAGGALGLSRRRRALR